MKKSEFMLHAAMFDQRLLDKTCTVIVVTLLYGCQISVLSALSLDFIKYKLKRSNADSFHHHLAYLPNRKLYPNIRCRCGLDTVILSTRSPMKWLDTSNRSIFFQYNLENDRISKTHQQKIRLTFVSIFPVESNVSVQLHTIHRWRVVNK